MKRFHSDVAGSFSEFDSSFLDSTDGTTLGLLSGTATPFSPTQDENDSFPLAHAAVSASGTTGGSAGSAKPVGTIPQLASYLVNGFWQFNGEIAHHWASPTITYNISGLTAAEQSLAQSALEAWHEVANVSFVQTTGAANITFNHNGSMTAFESDGYTNAGIMTSAVVDISADWITTDGGANDGKTGIDSYGYQTYLHEIGHALGLGHQGPYNGSAVYSANATYADDTWQYSVMSYFSENDFSGSSYRYVVTPQMSDIYAVDSIYGAANTRSGNTVYGFHDTAGSIYDFTAYSQAPALTIYDSGGNDTLDCSGYSANQTIDLHPGAFSSVGGLVNNIGISTTTVIENAIGGSGNDTLIANDFGCTLSGGAGNDTLIGGAGNDRLIGGPGVDRLTGGGGADTFVFATGDSSAAAGHHDLITDFVSGVDHIDLTGIDAISTTPADDLFNFIGATAFSHIAGQLDYVFNSALDVTVLEGDTNGDGVADFAIDLTGNLTIAAGDLIGIRSAGTVIESLGSTSLTQVANDYFLDSISAGTGPELRYTGAAVTAGQTGVWTPIGTEQTSGGYELAWKEAGANYYMIWNTDSNGNYISNVQGNGASIESYEASFHQDLNGDGVIGIPVSNTMVIESFGATSLAVVSSNYYLDSNSGGTGPELKYTGTAVTAGQTGVWAPIGAEQTSGGYEVAWKEAGADYYMIWNTDSGGNYVSNVQGTGAAIESYETSFSQDLNGDGVIGFPASHTDIIESFGSTSLAQAGNNYDLDSHSSGSGPALEYSGALVTAGQTGIWTPVGTEQTSGGYEVAWKVFGADQYMIWNTDSNGTYVSNVQGNGTWIESYETSFHQDFNGDGTIGIPTGQTPLADNTAPPSTFTVTAPNQTLTGTGSNDNFVFAIAPGNATITNFQPVNDVIQIDHSLFANVQALLSASQDDGHGNVVITADAHDTITLQHVTLAQLQAHQGDFHIT